MTHSELEALLSLIDDPDEVVYNQVRERILACGEEIIPKLENLWEHTHFGALFQQRIEDIIHHIQFDAVYNALHRWSRDGAQDLLEGSLLVARYQYPDMDETAVHSAIARIRQDIWLELNDDLTALEQVKVINHILFDVHGLRGNKKNYHAAQNSFINTVLETKKGNPLSLSIIYIILAESLGVPIFGVNLPNHFVLAYVKKPDLYEQLSENPVPDEVLFYLNAFSQGTIVHRNEITAYLDQINLPHELQFYNPCDNRSIVRRMLANLVFSYERLGYPDKVAEVKRLEAAIS
jgi:regulator of sirC expression with transglutaminase-like and TPR domain